MMCQFHGGTLEPMASWHLFEEPRCSCVHCIRNAFCCNLRTRCCRVDPTPTRHDPLMMRQVAGSWPQVVHPLPADPHRGWPADSYGVEFFSQVRGGSGRKNPTSFSITDILDKKSAEDSQSRTLPRTIVRPWDDEVSCSDRSRASCSESLPKSPTEADDTDNEDEEIDVGDDGARSLSRLDSWRGVDGPLDALLRMTSGTQFERKESLTSGYTSDESGANDSHQFELSAKKCILYHRTSHPVKKRRKTRTAFTNHQIFQLEKRFLYQKYLTPADRDELAVSLRLSNSQVITWFQNRRAKLKRDLEELRADVTAAKALGTEPPSIVLSRLDELLRVNDGTLKRKDRNTGDTCRSGSTNQSPDMTSSGRSDDCSLVSTTVQDPVI